MRLASLRHRTAFRLALAFGILFIVTFVISGAVMYHMLRVGLARQIDVSLHGMNSVIVSTYAPNDMEDLVTATSPRPAFQREYPPLPRRSSASQEMYATGYRSPGLVNICCL